MDHDDSTIFQCRSTYFMNFLQSRGIFLRVSGVIKPLRHSFSVFHMILDNLIQFICFKLLLTIRKHTILFQLLQCVFLTFQAVIHFSTVQHAET